MQHGPPMPSHERGIGRYGDTSLHKAAVNGHLDSIVSLCDAYALVTPPPSLSLIDPLIHHVLYPAIVWLPKGLHAICLLLA